MIRPADFFGASPKTVLTRPFFHAQEQKAYNADGGTSVADAWTARVLNTVIYNDIQGASLASNQVSLPAGTYYVEAFGMITQAGGTSGILSVFKDGVKAIQGTTTKYADLFNNGGSVASNVSGVVTLLSPGVIDLRYYTGNAIGLGISNNTGSIADVTIFSIYADLKIWQLDRSLEIAPKAINGGLQTIAGMNTEGGIMGADVTVSGNTLTITKGACMSSDLTTAMAVTVDTPVVLPATVNQDFYLFIVRLVAGGMFTYKAYTTLVGPSSDGLVVDKWRLVSYAKNNPSGVTMPYRQVANRIDWLTSNRPILTPSITAAYISYPISNVIPASVFVDAVITSVGYNFHVSNDGVTACDSDVAGGFPGLAEVAVSGIYIKWASATAPIHITSATLRR